MSADSPFDIRITDLRLDLIGDGREVNPDQGGVEPLPILRVETDAGITGLAECFRVPIGVARAAIGGADSTFGRQLVGRAIDTPSAWHRRLYHSMMHANRRGWAIMCLGALDVALWDIYGQVMDRPVWQLLGGADRCYFQNPESPDGSQPVMITPYCTIVSDTWNDAAMVDQQVARIQQLRELGYRAFKVEPMMSEPARMIQLARRAREALGPEPMLAVDVGYYFNDVPAALRVARALEEMDIAFFETPFPVDRPQPWAALARQTRVPLAMGEHGVTRWEFQAMMEHGGVSVVQPYMTTCGGLTEARAIVEQATDFGAAVMPGNWSTQILGAATVHLAAWSPRTPWIEFAPAEIFASPLRAALQRLGPPVVDGRIALPSAPGIGYTLPDALIDEYRLPE